MAVPIDVLVAMAVVSGILLAALAAVARRHGAAGRLDVTVSEGAAVDGQGYDADELAAHADAVSAAAQHAALIAQQMQDRAVAASELRDAAQQRYLDTRRQRQAVVREHPCRLVERAAVQAYRRGQLSVAELNRIWEHLQIADSASGSERAEARDGHVEAARKHYEQAAVDAHRAMRDAEVAAVAAEALADEAEFTEAQACVARSSEMAGLALLFAPAAGR